MIRVFAWIGQWTEMGHFASRQVQGRCLFWSNEHVETPWRVLGGQGSRQEHEERSQRWTLTVSSFFLRVVQALLEPPTARRFSHPRSRVRRGTPRRTWVSPRASRTLKPLRDTTTLLLALLLCSKLHSSISSTFLANLGTHRSPF